MQKSAALQGRFGQFPTLRINFRLASACRTAVSQPIPVGISLVLDTAAFAQRKLDRHGHAMAPLSPPVKY